MNIFFPITKCLLKHCLFQIKIVYRVNQTILTTLDVLHENVHLSKISVARESGNPSIMDHQVVTVQPNATSFPV